MKELLFLTDRYPYNNSEAFIENEIEITSKFFDKVYILPCGLMVDTKTCRNVPENVVIVDPPCQDNIYSDKPSIIKKVSWGLTNLLFWYIRCLFSKLFYREIYYMIKSKQFNIRRVLRCFRTLAPSLRNAKYYRKKLKNEELHNVYVYSYWIEPTVLLGKKIVSANKIQKEICRTHRWDLYSEESSVGYLPFQKQIIEYIDKLYVISDDGRDYLIKKYPDYTDKIVVSRLGTKDHGLNSDRTKDDLFLIVSCSNIIPVKRVELIIDALSYLESSDVSIYWLHFGAGQYLSDVKKYASEKLNNNVNYNFMGQVSNEELMNFYQNNHVDLFVNTSSSEGIPVSIMEAISFGIPVAATDVGGTREIVFNGENGILLEKNFNPLELTTFIKKMIENKNQNIMRRKAREYWQNFYYCNLNYEMFYRDIIDIQ